MARPWTSGTGDLAASARVSRIAWLPLVVLLINLGGLVVLSAYSQMNLRPEVSAAGGGSSRNLRELSVLVAVLLPAAAALAYVWPIARWSRRRGLVAELPAGTVERAANAPLVLAAISLAGWILLTGLSSVRALMLGPDLPIGVAAHLALRPFFVGLVAGTATLFAAEVLCRAYVWPILLQGTSIVGNRRLHRVRVSHRLLLLWLAISALPLGAVLLTSYARIAGMDLDAEPLLRRVVYVVLLIAASAAAGGAFLVWLVSRSIAEPLKVLEDATQRLREGKFETRVPVTATDEIGSLAEGFNLMAARLSDSYLALEVKNRDLSAALDRVILLEHVKRGLDRFVPDVVRRTIEADPEGRGLAKATKDVSVLFLDIEGYTRLSEALPRSELNAIVERYFSLFLESIRAEGGDINETAGDGLMIIFQNGTALEHACAAVRAALAIREQAKAANRVNPEGHPQIVVNIGISSGECDVGVTRFQGPAGERWTFTASGTVTNLAARLGDYAAGGGILVSAETASRVRDRFSLRSLGTVSLKNLSVGLEAWEVEGMSDAATGLTSNGRGAATSVA